MAESTGDENKSNSLSEFSYKIIIIGAGIAGISTAHHLIKNGETNFKILEARNRIGGRIISVPMGNSVIDLGATWIHGVLENPVYELAAANGLIDVTEDRPPHTIVATTEEGKRIPISIVKEVYSAYFWFSKRCEEYFILHLHPPNNVNNSVGKHIEIDIHAYLEQYEGEDVEIRRMIFDHLLNRETCITGCHSMDETGLTDFGSYSELPGGNITIPDGFFSVIDYLTESIPEDSIRLHSVVECINWKNKHENPGSSSNSTATNSPHSVSIKCEDGTVWCTNHVVITIPLGVLKDKPLTLFQPPLPDYKLECLEKLCFGTVDKIYLLYDRPFLNAGITEVITLWKRTEENDMDKIWYRKIYSFSKFSENILLAWVSGKEAEYLETLSNEQVAETCTTILRKFLNDPYVPKPCKVICTAWNSQPHTRGSYTSIGVKGSQRDIELLAAPIYSDPYQGKPVLSFAGEATHSTFYSTAHGAFLSGKKAAEVLLEPDTDGEMGAQATSRDLSSWLRGIDLG